MKKFALPVLLALASPSLAEQSPQVDKTCLDIPGSMRSCSPLVGCLGNSGTYFTGRAFGRDTGSLAVDTNAGATCAGTWVGRNAFGTGQADFTCDDGQSGKVIFHYQDGNTGTVKGFGITNRGTRIKAWSGHYIQDFINAENGALNTRLMCGEIEIPLS